MNHNGLLCCTKKTGPGRLVPVGWGFVEVCRWCWRTGTGLWERHQLSKPRRFHSSVWCHFARCGNVHLHCSICSDIFLLASRYNKKKREKRNPISKKTVLFEQWGPTLQSRAQGRNSGKRGWSCLLYSLSVQPAREQGLETIQGMPGGLKRGRVDRLEPPHCQSSEFIFSPVSRLAAS